MGNLSKDFDFSEFFTEGKAFRDKVALHIPDIYQRILRKLVEPILQPLHDYLGMPLRITSGCRSDVHNAEIGGQPNSHHLFRQDKSAADFITKDMQAAWDWLMQKRSEFCYCYWNKIKNFIHVSGLTNNDNRIGLMWIDDKDGRHWEPDTPGKEINL